jgi:hypothetical protein
MNISDKSFTDGISRVNTILQIWLQQAAKVFKKTSQIMPFLARLTESPKTIRRQLFGFLDFFREQKNEWMTHF